VEVHTEEEVFLTPPAVADVIHLLAELIDNATVYSPAPSPVGVRAGMVAKGLAVEVEDRGLGMSDEDYAAFNAHLGQPPQFDVVALADDLRLGMFVIARLATRHGIAVTLRSSPYGGTTAIVLIPHDIVVREPLESPCPDGELTDSAGSAGSEGSPAQEPVGTVKTAAAPTLAPDRQTHERSREAQPLAARARTAEAPASHAAPGASHPDPGAAGRGGIAPLPRRVPQTSLAAELREDSPASEADDSFDDFTAERAASSLSGFQRGTLQARDNDTDTTYDQGEETAPEDAPEAASVTSTPPADRS
jgi:hypothetical protein